LVDPVKDSSSNRNNYHIQSIVLESQLIEKPFSSKNQFGLFFLKPVLIKIFVNLLAP